MKPGRDRGTDADRADLRAEVAIPNDTENLVGTITGLDVTDWMWDLGLPSFE